MVVWGPDVEVFNPDREFRTSEIWDEKGFAAYNPATERFSPFTFGKGRGHVRGAKRG
eukprot:gene6577-7780_t